MDLTDKFVFLSGPMTGRDHYNVAAFAEAHAAIKEAGAAYVHDPAIRYLVKRQHKIAAMDHDGWMLDNLHELTERERRDQLWHDVVPRKYDLVVQLEGWEASDGAVAECQAAHACGIPCMTLAEALS